jgi:hypothetical protein
MWAIPSTADVRTFTCNGNSWPKLVSHAVDLAVSLSFNANGTMASKAVGYDLAMTAARRRNTHAVNTGDIGRTANDGADALLTVLANGRQVLSFRCGRIF